MDVMESGDPGNLRSSQLDLDSLFILMLPGINSILSLIQSSEKT